ncbi:ANTAR domain-containing response regulator [Desulfitibacter alkalitolerans]|uniref:ANTAR domain-containing response regulator n=1 Tax=Desulfitibacter alkalitolerans TaxID=264641 RepID=UPI0004874ACC|nr:ANTAR domain-containing protein [Desulfitibacter alkalitolerans]
MNELRCIIGGDEINYPYSIEEFIVLEGHLVVAKHNNERPLLQSIINIRPDAVIINTSMEAKNLLELCKNISEQKIAPIIIIGNQLEAHKLSAYMKTDVFSFLIAPINRDNFISVLEFSLSKFQQIVNLEKKVKEYEKQIEHRALIEKAKGLVMKNKGMTEEEAYSMMRKISMDQCISMQRVAKAIIKKLG